MENINEKRPGIGSFAPRDLPTARDVSIARSLRPDIAPSGVPSGAVANKIRESRDPSNLMFTGQVGPQELLRIQGDDAGRLRDAAATHQRKPMPFSDVNNAPSIASDAQPARKPIVGNSGTGAGEFSGQRGNAYLGKFAAREAGGQGIFTDPATGRTSIRLTGDEGRAFMDGELKSAERTKIPTVNPGNTLATSPTPLARKPLAYNGAFAGGDQAKAEDALFRRRMEVLKADQASGQASRSDYVSPFETNTNRRAELDAQQKKNVEDIAARQVSEATTRMLNDQDTGQTSDRNLAMMPYEQRRAIINDRRNLIALNADMQAKRMEEEGKAAGRRAAMTREEMEDRRLRDTSAQEIAARAEENNSTRGNALEVAKIQAGAKTSRDYTVEQTLKARSDAISAVLGGMNPDYAQSPEFNKWLDSVYPLPTVSEDPYKDMPVL